MSRAALLLVAGMVAAPALVACDRGTPDTAPDRATIVRIVDGDTIDIEIGGRDERVRLTGVDTPEVAHDAWGDRPANPAECFGDDATAFTTSLIPPGAEVRLERDVVPRDDYGRLLAYVYRAEDGLFVNRSLAEDGYADTLDIAPNGAHAAELAQVVSTARAEGRGLWGACGGADVPVR